MPDQTLNDVRTRPGADKNNFPVAVAALLISFIYIKLKIYHAVLTDPFHEGEYFSALSSILHDVDFVVLTIHGALDYLPGLLAEYIYGREHYFFATQLLYLCFDLMAAILALGIIKIYTESRPRLLVAGFVLPYLVGYREFSLFLLMMLFIVSYGQKEIKKSLLLQLGLGLAAAFNFYWSTNRGIAGTITFGIICLLLAIKQKEYFVSIATFFLSLVLISSIHKVVEIKHYLENIIFLTQTSYQWSYELSAIPIGLKLFMLFLLLSANFLILRHFIISRSNLSHVLMFLLLSVFFMQISTYRADIAHIYMGLPIYMIALAYWHNTTTHSVIKQYKYEQPLLVLNIIVTTAVAAFFNNRPIFIVSIYVMLIVYQRYYASYYFKRFLPIKKYGIIVLFALFIVPVFSKYQKGAYDWVWVYKSTPTNRMLSTEGMRWIADELKKSNTKCVFDLTNNGVINGLVDLPACTRFSYIVYADRNYEEEIIASLHVKRPTAIVYSTSYWSYSIDDRTMPNRFPNLDKYVLENYQFIKCANDYCVRYLNKPT